MVDGDTGALPPRERIVLAVLGVRRDETVSPDVLADAIWGDELPVTWTKSVQACVVHLRRLLGAGAIETYPDGYRLVVPADHIDVHRFVRLLARAREMMGVGEPDRALYLAEEALKLWRGRALGELDDWGPGRREAERLDELRKDARELRLEASLRTGRFRDVLAEAQAMVGEEPLREHRWSLLALAQYQASRQADALRTIDRARTVLVNELGLDPGPDLVALEQAILHQDPSLVATVMPEPSSVCPYRGLVPYDVSDADHFFGRGAEVAQCLGRLDDIGVLVVVGPSGSGKSSLVRAGVAAALAGDGHRVAVVTPGAHPVETINASVPPGRQAVLVVDQCEEAVTLCHDADEQRRFFDSLVEFAEKAPLVVALRADRLGEVTAFAGFARLVERGLFLLRPISGNDLRAAIEGPAAQAGLRLEPGLVDLLIREVEGEPGAMPLLSHALRQTWESREGRTLTVTGYQASGGIRGAVAQSAEAVYEQAPEDQRPILRDLLLRLVSPGLEGEPVRSRVPRRVVATDPEHEEMIEHLVAARLVTSDQDVVEIAHESLARAWPRLRGWLDDDVEGERIRRHLAAAAESWEAMGRADSELYRGIRLVRATEWRRQTSPALSQTEQAYLDASEQRDSTEQRARRRRRRSVVGGLAAGLAVMTTLAAVAFVSHQRAEREADLARTRELTNAAIIALEVDPALAKLLALAAADLGEPSIDVMSVLHRSHAADHVVGRYRWPDDHDLSYMTARLHPSGSKLVASGTFLGSSSYLEVYDFDHREVLWSWDTGNPSISIDVPLFSPDGEWVVAGVVRGPDADPAREPVQEPDEARPGAYIWDADTGELVRHVALGRCGGLVLGMAGSWLLTQTRPDHEAPACWTGAGPHALELVDATSGTRRVLSTSAWERRAAISGNGGRVAFTEGGDAGPVSVVLDLSTDERIMEIDVSSSEWHSAAEVIDLNHDGSLLAAGFNPIVIVDVAAGDPVATFRGHGGDGWSRFSPDGQTVYSVGQDGILRHWDAHTGAEIAKFPAVGSGLSPSMSVNGLVLAADATGRRASLVDPRPMTEVWALETCDGYVWAQTLGVTAGHGALSIQCADEHVTYVFDVARREVDYALPLHRGQTLAISPDGTRLARQEGAPPDGEAESVSWHGPPGIRDLATGETLAEFEGVCTWDAAEAALGQGDHPGCRRFPETPFELFSWSMTWSPDSSLVAVGGAPKVTLTVWEASTGSMVGTSDACTNMAQGMQFSPDGDELLLFCLEEGVLTSVSTEDWQELRRSELANGVDDRNYMALAGFTPDDRWLIGISGAMFVGGTPMLHWIDPATLEIDQTLPEIHEGTTKSWAMSPNRGLLATGSADGFVKVWDVVARRLVHEIDIESTQVQGLAFVGDHHLAVAPEAGGVFVSTLDAPELVDIVRSSLTRDFTPDECERFDLVGVACPPASPTP